MNARHAARPRSVRCARRALPRRWWCALALLGAGLSGYVLAGCSTKEAPPTAPPPSPAPAPEAPAEQAPATATEQRAPAVEAEPASNSSAGRAAAPAKPKATASPPPAFAAPRRELQERPAEGSAARKRAESKGGLGAADADERAQQPSALLQRLRQESAQQAADCPSARDRRDAICSLAERICQLVDRDPNVASIADYCSEARQRCQDAGKRTAAQCDG